VFNKIRFESIKKGRIASTFEKLILNFFDRLEPFLRKW